MKLQINYETLKKEAIIRSIKMLDIGIITIIYFVIGYFVSWGVNKIYYNFNPNEHPNKILIFLEISNILDFYQKSCSFVHLDFHLENIMIMY